MSRAGNYDIVGDQGSSLSLHLAWQDDSGNGLTLDSYDARMQVRRSPSDNGMLIWATGSTVDVNTGNPFSSSVTSGISFSDFLGPTGGTSSGGSIKMSVGPSGATGYTGGILISFDADTMANVPAGKHFYDFEIYNGTTVYKLVKGRFEVEAEVTR
jgi:hypothetical protein